MSEIIRMENVVKVYEGGCRAINGVSLRICKGERALITGAPGSGKTTLMRLIAGMDRPSDGEIHVLGQAVHEMDADTAADFRNRHMGLLGRFPAFMDRLTVLENVMMPLTLRGVPAAQRGKTAREQLKTLGLLYAGHARPQQLTVLEAKLASIARALIAQPEILLLDDMTAGLSGNDTDQITDTLRVLFQDREYTIIEFTGSAGGIIDADKTVILDHGKQKEEMG